MFLFSTLTKLPSYRLSSAQGSPTVNGCKLDKEKHSALALGVRSVDALTTEASGRQSIL